MEGFKSEKSSNGDKNKNSFKKGLRKAAGILGLASIALLSKEKSDIRHETKIDPINQNKIEWTKSELQNEKLNEIILKKDTKERIDYLKEVIKSQDEIINSYSKEYDTRMKTGIMSAFTNISTKDLLEEVTNARSFKKMTEQNLMDIDKYKLSDLSRATREQIKKEILGSLEFYDKGRAWLLENIKKEEYKNRLLIEQRNLSSKIFKSILEKDAINEQNLRKSNIQKGDYFLSENIEESFKINNGADNDNNKVEAFYNSVADKVVFKLDQHSELEAVDDAIHEYAHKITKANKQISLSTISLLSEAFDSTSTVVNFVSDKGIYSDKIIHEISYYADPTEIYARKKVFDYDLERLGVKKYEEKFTMKHYLKALELQKKGVLMDGSNDFLKIIKPKMIVKVMNEIAQVESTNEGGLENIST